MKDLSSIPKKRRRIIKFFIDHPDDIAISTTRELAKKLEVNPGTVVRAAKDMGYSGFHELKNDRKQSFKLNQYNPYEIVLKSIKKKSSEEEIVKRSLLKDVEILSNTVADISDKDIESVAELIKSSNRVFLIGLEGAARAVVGFLAAELRTYIYNVFEINRFHGPMADVINHLGENDIIICVSFRRCIRQSVEVLKHAKGLGCSTVAITDSKVSPLCDHGMYNLITGVSAKYVFSSTISAMSICSSMIQYIVETGEEKAINNLENLKRWLENDNVYYSE